MGRPLLPWQRAGVDVGLELDEHGRYWYSTVLVLVPRQAGKTLAVSLVAEDRCLSVKAARCWYTSTSGAAAGTWMRDEHVPLLATVPALAGAYRTRMSAGAESVRWPGSGSHFTAFAPTRDALHGKQSDLVVVDEAWAHDGLRGAELLTAIGPTQATRPGAQLWIVSAAGDAASAFLIDQLTLAREAGAADRVCLIEYGVPDDMDATDPDTAARYHPGVAAGLIDAGYLATERDRMGPDAFARSYGNRFTAARASVIPAHRWDELAEPAPAQPGRVAVGFDVEHDGSRAAVAVAWLAAGRYHVELTDDRDGTGWLPERLAELHRAYRTPAAYGAGGPALSVADHATRAGTPLSPIVGRDWYAACESFRAATEPTAVVPLAHHHQPALDGSVASADARRVGDVWAWDRRAPAARLAPLTAATAALWAAQHDPGPRPRPVILGLVS